MAHPLACIADILTAAAAGTALAPESVLALSAALEEAISTGEPLEACLRLTGQWRAAVRRQRLADTVRALAPPGGTASGRARELHRRLRHYATTAYRVDRRSGAAARPDDQPLFDVIRAHRGRVPSDHHLRKLLTQVG